MTAIKRLKELELQKSRERSPNLPEYARVAYKYSDKKANGLTRCIIDWIKFNGGQAERISVTGRYIDNSKVVTDVLGNKRKIGSGTYIPSNMQVGSADISATIKNKNGIGLSCKIEVKIGRDIQSPEQKKYQEQVESAGGVYIIARNFEDFVKDYERLVK